MRLSYTEMKPTAIPLHFDKYEGLGNDFIVLKAVDLPGAPAQWAPQLCDRHTGIGADGLLLFHPSVQADARMQVINADGSEPEMCGNGLRCFVRWLAQNTPQAHYRIETGAGLREADLNGDQIQVAMGAPRLQPHQIPASGWQGTAVLEQPLSVAERVFSVSLVSMGNPHCVIAVGPEWTPADTRHWGPLIEHHSAFPQRTNVEFVWFESPTQAHVSVWERGAGATRACGTGACATLVAGVLSERLHTQARIVLPGGPLWIEWQRPENQINMTGPARHVFSGVYNLKIN